MRCKRKSWRFLIGFSLVWGVPWAILAWLPFCHASAAESLGKQQKKVLVILSSRREAPYTVLVENAFRKTLGDALAGHLDYYTEYIDFARFSALEYEKAMRDFLRRKYAGQSLDVVITEGNAPFEFVVRHRAEIFPGVPLVFSTEEGKLRPVPNSTGVVFPVDMKSTLDLALTLQPNVKQVFVIRGASEFDIFYEKIARRQFREYEGRLALTYLPPMPMKDLLEEVARLPEDSIIYFVSLFEDGAGNRFIPVDALNMLSPVASTPIYCWAEMTLDYGVVGGNLLSEENVARHTAELALRVLRGENPDRIPSAEIRPYINVFNWHQLRRWRISEDRLPPGSMIRFKQLTFWEQYKRRIIAAIALFLIQTVLIIILLAQRIMRKRAEGALRDSEARYRQMFEQNCAVKLLIDPVSGAIVKANTAASEFYGYSREALERMKITDINTLQPEQVAIEMSRAATENCPYFVFRHRLASGEVRDVEVHSSPLEMGGRRLLYSIIHDISERRRTEERLRGFFELPLVGMAITSPDRHFLFVNQKLCDMLGYSTHELTGMTWVEVTHPEDIAESFLLLEQTLSGETDGYRMDKRFLHRDGHVVYASISARCVRRDDGAVDYLVLIVEDISERKQAEEGLTRLNAELEQRISARTADLAAKTRELETFAYSVAHDLKAPLRGIDGYSRLLLKRYADHLDENVHSFLSNVCDATQQMNQLIDDLLAYSRFEGRSLMTSHIDLPALIRAVVDEKSHDLRERKAELIIDIECNEVAADADGLAQSLRNLIDNAIKFSRDVEHPHIEIGARSDGEICRMWVRDNGIGFDMQFHDRIFEIFQRLHQSEDYTGTGVGLALVRKAMMRMSGRVWAESAPGEGATFYLELPHQHAIVKTVTA